MSNLFFRRATVTALCAAAVLGLGTASAQAATVAPAQQSSSSSSIQRPGDSVDVRVLQADVRGRMADRDAFVAAVKDQFGDEIPADFHLVGANLYRIEATSPSWGNVSPDRYTNFSAVVGLAWDSPDGSVNLSNVLRINYERTQFVGLQLTPDQLWGGDQILTSTPRLSLAEALAGFENYRTEQGHQTTAVSYAALRTPDAGAGELIWMFVCDRTPYYVNAQTGEVSMDVDSAPAA